MKKIPCYICQKEYDLDDDFNGLVRCLRSHTELESRIAYRKAIDAEKAAQPVVEDPEPLTKPGKRKRGRPRKEAIAEAPEAEEPSAPVAAPGISSSDISKL